MVLSLEVIGWIRLRVGGLQFNQGSVGFSVHGVLGGNCRMELGLADKGVRLRDSI